MSRSHLVNHKTGILSHYNLNKIVQIEMKNFVYLLITANQIDKGVVTAIKELSLLKLCEEVANPQQLKIVQKGSFLKEEEQNNRLVYIVKSGLFRIGVEYQQSTLP